MTASASVYNNGEDCGSPEATINMDSEPQIESDVPVLVVGGGPAGLLMAYLLSRLGGKFSTIS